MTAVPPPVPPEIVRRAAEALAEHFMYEADDADEGIVGIVLAAVYGDIVGPLLAEVERLRQVAAVIEIAHNQALDASRRSDADRARAVEAARRDALRSMRCDARAPSLAPNMPSPPCVRNQGHSGWHEAASGMEWIGDAPPHAPNDGEATP